MAASQVRLDDLVEQIDELETMDGESPYPYVMDWVAAFETEARSHYGEHSATFTQIATLIELAEKNGMNGLHWSRLKERARALRLELQREQLQQLTDGFRKLVQMRVQGAGDSMATIHEQVKELIGEIERDGPKIRSKDKWVEWATRICALMRTHYGEDSPSYRSAHNAAHLMSVRSRGGEREWSILEASLKALDKTLDLSASDVTPAVWPLCPAGSPYGFTDMDRQMASQRRGDTQTLYVVLGMQFKSKHYDAEALVRNVSTHFQDAVQQYNERHPAEKVTLHFDALKAGLGEHLFNEIARSIIGADIAVYETSDLNPNVMLELGVALTWGVRVLPIKLEGRRRPPSDISGQTWVDYKDSGAVMPRKFDRDLVTMIERVMSEKRNRAAVRG